jgi:23S rRNA (pseudouridine1915-N3)-methyltransferase
MQLIAVGRLRDGAEAELFARYNARLRPKLAVTEIAEAAGSPDEMKRREAAGLLAALPKNAWAVALDLAGANPDSEMLAVQMEAWLGGGRPLCFLIGGAEGLDRSVLERADAILSFGRMTWPHRLVRVMLAEQLFRARSIASGHPYHRSGRP